MKKLQLQQNSDEWFAWRRGKMTGSRLKDIIVKRGNGRKLGFYEIMAERLSVDPSHIDDPMGRGSDLEQDAIDAFAIKTRKKVNTDCGVWVSDDSPDMALSPDGEIGKTEAVEAKCLSSARHLQAYFEQTVPSEYEEQTVDYFIINEKLKRLYVIFYDPRIVALPMHYIVIERKDIEDKIEAWRQYQLDTLEEINTLINELTF